MPLILEAQLANGLDDIKESSGPSFKTVPFEALRQQVVLWHNQEKIRVDTWQDKRHCQDMHFCFGFSLLEFVIREQRNEMFTS